MNNNDNTSINKINNNNNNHNNNNNNNSMRHSASAYDHSINNTYNVINPKSFDDNR